MTEGFSFLTNKGNSHCRAQRFQLKIIAFRLVLFSKSPHRLFEMAEALFFFILEDYRKQFVDFGNQSLLNFDF